MNSPAPRLLLCSSPRHDSQTLPPITTGAPPLPDTRQKIRQRGFHIHSRHPLAKQIPQFKSILIHLPRLSAQPESDMSRHIQLSIRNNVTRCALALPSIIHPRHRFLRRRFHKLSVPGCFTRIKGAFCALQTTMKTTREREISHRLAPFWSHQSQAALGAAERRNCHAFCSRRLCIVIILHDA